MSVLLRISKQPAAKYLAGKGIRFPRTACDLLEALYEVSNKRAIPSVVFDKLRLSYEVEEMTIAWESLLDKRLLVNTGKVKNYEKEARFDFDLLAQISATVRQRKGMYFSGIPFRMASMIFQHDPEGLGVDGRELTNSVGLRNVRLSTLYSAIRRLERAKLLRVQGKTYGDNIHGIRVFWTDELRVLMESSGFAPNDVNMIRASLKTKLDLVISNATREVGYRVMISQEEARFLKAQIAQLETSFETKEVRHGKEERETF